jgi:ubiquinone/menaquinone biosynthesis C-methylase UbiE
LTFELLLGSGAFWAASGKKECHDRTCALSREKMNKIKQVQEYWDEYTTEIQTQFTGKELGSREYFQEIKIHHDKAYALSNRILDLPNLTGKSVLEVGCGIGLDALEYAKRGARVAAIDLSPICMNLAKTYFSYNNLNGVLKIGNAEQLPYKDNEFDVVVARQILMFTPDPQKAVDEMLRVLKPGGEAIALLHNRHSWYAVLGKVTGTNLVAEAEDPPVNRLHSIKEAHQMFQKFSVVKIILDKFPSKTKRRTGVLARLYNLVFIPVTKIIPRGIIRPFGWYIIIKAIK